MMQLVQLQWENNTIIWKITTNDKAERWQLEYNKVYSHCYCVTVNCSMWSYHSVQEYRLILTVQVLHWSRLHRLTLDHLGIQDDRWHLVGLAALLVLSFQYLQVLQERQWSLRHLQHLVGLQHQHCLFDLVHQCFLEARRVQYCRVHQWILEVL